MQYITNSYKNDEAFFTDVIDLFKNAYSMPREKALRKADTIKKAIAAFVMRPKSIQRAVQAGDKKKIAAFNVSTDFERLTRNSFNVTIEEDNFDLAWEKAFRQIPLSRGELVWEIYNVSNGIAFNKVEEGGRIQVDSLEGTLVTAETDYYGGALGWTDKMIRARKIPAMLDMAMLFRNKFWINKANNHYVLLAVAAAVNAVTAYQGAAAEGQLRRDIQTINVASFTLTNRLKDKGYGDTANARLIGYANPLDRERIQAAMTSQTGNISQALGVGQTVGYNIEWNFTYNTNIVSGSPILVFPGQKAQRADALAPTNYAPQGADPLTLNMYQAVWAIYGAAVADTDQVQQLTLG